MREATGLTRQISAFDAMSTGISGCGLYFVFIGFVFTSAYFPGANPTMMEIMGFLLALPIIGVYILLSVAISRTGGDYVWVSRIANPPLGFITNFTISVLSLSFVGIITPQVTEWAAADIFYDLGRIYGNAGYVSLASYLMTPDPTFWVSVAIVIVCGVIVLLGVKLATYFLRYWTIIAIIIGVIFVAVVLNAGPATFKANFDALSGTTYDKVISDGVQAGAYQGVPSIFSSYTLFAGISGASGVSGFFFPAYFAAEVKQVKRTLIVSQLGAALVWCVFQTVIAAVIYFGMGVNFANSINYLYGIGSSNFPYLTFPLASGLSMFWTTNPYLVILFNLAYIGTIIAMNISIIFTMVRSIFAWSFDRVLPESFASMNETTHTPVNATILLIAGSLIFTYVAVYQFGLIASIYSYSTAGIFIGFLIVAATAIILPYKRKDIFQAADALSKGKLAGIPYLAILGVLGVICSLVVVYAALIPALGVTFITVLIEGVIPTFLVGAVIYAVAWAVRRRQGINLGLTLREIPPE